MIAMLSSWSGLPQVLPNIIAPRQNGLTRTPVEPSTRVVMFATLWGLVGRLSDGRCPGRSRLLRRRTTLPLSALPGKVAARLSGATNLSRWLASLGGSSGLAVPATVGHPALLAAWQDRTAAREALHAEPVVERFLCERGAIHAPGDGSMPSSIARVTAAVRSDTPSLPN